MFFIVSGACGLVYEVAWARYLGLFLGNTTLAHMCVLAVYMGGLAIGSVALGDYTRKLRRPLAVYGLLEAFIGLYAIAYPMFINPIQDMALRAGSGMEFGGTPLTLLKLVTAGIVLFIPTFLMGGTFPILMRHFQPEKSNEDKGEWLYLSNCGGAVIGALLAGFTLIPSLGMVSTLNFVGVVNITLGALAVVLAYIYKPLVPEPVQDKKSIAVSKATRNPWFIAIAVAMALSGLASMVYELVWIRIFAFTLGSSTYSFTLMVAAFITGLAIGSLLVGAIPKLRANPMLWLAVSEAFIGIMVMISIPMYERLPYIFWKWSYLLNPTPSSIWLHDLFKYALCFLVMTIPTIFSGMTLPLAIKAVARHGTDIGKDSGLIYGANTGGTLVGAILTGMVLIPMIGLRHSLEVGLIINLVIGIWLFWATDTNRVTRITALCSGVVLVILLLAWPQWNPMSFTRGTFRHHNQPPTSWAKYAGTLSEWPMLSYEENSSGTTVVLAAGSKEKGYYNRALFVDGKAEGSEYFDNPTQVLVSQLPLLFKTDAREVLMVGLGSGVSAGSAVTHPDVHLDCVEISPAVARAAECFKDANHDVLHNPKMNLIIEDARTVLAMTNKKYDAIINEPTNPWIAGMGNLFSIDFFHHADRILKPDGVIVQWFHTYEISDDLVRIIVRTMHKVFPYTVIFQGAKNDYIVVGSRKPFQPDYNAIAQRLLVPTVKADMDRINVTSVDALLALQVLSPEGAKQFAGEGVINTDDRPVLEYQAPNAQYIGQEAEVLRQSDERYTNGKNLLGIIKQQGKPLSRENCLSILRAYSDPRMDNPRLLMALLQYYVSKWPEDTEKQWAFGSVYRSADLSAATQAAARALNGSKDGYSYELMADLELIRKQQAMSAYTPQDFRKVVDLLNTAQNKLPRNVDIAKKIKHAKDLIK